MSDETPEVELLDPETVEEEPEEAEVEVEVVHEPVTAEFWLEQRGNAWRVMTLRGGRPRLVYAAGANRAAAEAALAAYTAG